ncbi:MAG: hypothetical protein WD382_08835 [Halofilum sp. (in: g-proteobacteria)]
MIEAEHRMADPGHQAVTEGRHRHVAERMVGEHCGRYGKQYERRNGALHHRTHWFVPLCFWNETGSVGGRDIGP